MLVCSLNMKTKTALCVSGSLRLCVFRKSGTCNQYNYGTCRTITANAAVTNYSERGKKKKNMETLTQRLRSRPKYLNNHLMDCHCTHIHTPKRMNPAYFSDQSINQSIINQ